MGYSVDVISFFRGGSRQTSLPDLSCKSSYFFDISAWIFWPIQPVKTLKYLVRVLGVWPFFGRDRRITLFKFGMVDLGLRLLSIYHLTFSGIVSAVSFFLSWKEHFYLSCSKYFLHLLSFC